MNGYGSHKVTTTVVETGPSPDGVSASALLGGAALSPSTLSHAGSSPEAQNLVVPFDQPRSALGGTNLPVSLVANASGTPVPVLGQAGSDGSVTLTGASAFILPDLVGPGASGPDFRIWLAGGAGEQEARAGELADLWLL
jgi:hypothetical protein